MWHNTKFPGIRYREHRSRKHGVRFDRYYQARYSYKGKRHEEALGWASEGMTPERANAVLAELKEAARLGNGPKTLKEKREIEDLEREQQHAEEARLRAEEERRITFKEASKRFLEWAKSNKKDWQHDETRLRLHILPILGKRLLQDIEPAHVERLKIKCQEKNMAPATVLHCLQAVRVIFNFSARMGLFQGTNPTKGVRFPKPDNKRDNFFTPAQVERLLEYLWPVDMDAHDIMILSTYAGLRFSECARLRWEAVDLEHAIVHVRDAKSGESRKAFITDIIGEMLERRKQNATGNALVFPNSKGGVYKDIGNHFAKAVEALGFNEGFEDRRQRLTFHSCRHTFGSWLAMQGTPIFTIQQLMGHKTIEMTLRYAHLSPDTKREAVELMAKRASAGNKVVSISAARR